MSSFGWVERKMALNGAAAFLSYLLVALAPHFFEWRLAYTIQTIALACFLGFTLLVIMYPFYGNMAR